MHAEAELACGRHEFRDGLAEFAITSDSVGDDCSPAATKVDEPLVPQQLVGPKNRVNVDVERTRYVTSSGKTITGAQGASAGIRSNGCGELFEQRDRACGVDTEEHPLSLIF
jgi:hypothetical protein